MRSVLTLMLAAVLGATAAPAKDSPAIDTKNAVYIEGVVGNHVMERIDSLVKASSVAPVEELQLVLNSPGGAVMPGTIFIDMLEILKTRGTKITCFVPMLAASMAFQILAHCDTRYALPGALLLWHPVRVTIFMAALAPSDTAALNEELTRIETRLIDDLKPRLGVSDDTFYHHYHAETLHTSGELNVLTPGWLTIVDDMPGLKKLLPFGGGGDEEEESRTITRDWMFVYRMPERTSRE